MHHRYLVTPFKGRGVDQPQLTHTLVRGAKVDIYKEMIRQVLFGPEYVGTTTIIEFDYHMRLMKSRCTMRKVGDSRVDSKVGYYFPLS